GPQANTLNKIKVIFDRAISLSTFTAPDVILVGPDGRRIPIWNVKVVNNTGDRTYEITFATQSASGAYAMHVGPEVRDLAGTRMVAYDKTFVINTSRTYTTTANANILPRGRAVSLLTINDDIKIGDLNVKLNIEHPRISDLYIHLQAPDG